MGTSNFLYQILTLRLITAIKIILWFFGRVTTTQGTVVKDRSVRNVENHCSRAFGSQIFW